MPGDADVTASLVHAFADRAWDQFLESNPLWATVQGDERWDDRLDDPSPAGRAAFMAMVEAWAAEISQLERVDLAVEDSVTLALMRAVVWRFRSAHARGLWQLDALDQIGGPQALVGELARFQRTDTQARFEKLLARLARYPGWIEAHRANVAEGVAAGRTAPAEVLDRCLDQTRRLVQAPAAESPLMLANVDLAAEQRAALLAAVEEHVQPALKAWLATLEDYAAHVRSGPGLCYLPDGAALYRHHIRAYTNFDEDPQAIHDYGLARLDEIEAAEAPIAAELGHQSVASLRAFLDTDAANHVKDPADLLAAAEAWILRAEAEAPRWFGNPPAEQCVVKAVEPHAERDAPAAFYYPPADDGSRPGTYFFNTYDPPSRPLHQAVPMTYHEAVPGHHFQFSVERHLGSLPAFRRHGAMLACTAYVEGWALYAERLAVEMGLYHTPLERFGAWESEAHRAARLVVDTGLHAFGWTRQQSIDLLVQRAGLARLDADDRDRSLHRLARPGPQLHDRPAGDPATACTAGSTRR